MRVIVSAVRGIRNLHALHHLNSSRPGLSSRRAFMQLNCFGDLVTDGVDRIERCHRVLKDHRDFSSAQTPYLLVVERHQVFTAKTDFTAGYSSWWGNQPHY